MSRVQIEINRRQYLELQNIATGVFAPLAGFMNEDQFTSVVDTMRLPGGEPFTIPVVLDLSENEARRITGADRITLVFQGMETGELIPESCYNCDKDSVVDQVFQTRDVNHPGVSHFYQMGDWFVGGPVRLKRQIPLEFTEFELTPEQTRSYIAERGWRTVVGFQTRNVPHRAHEHLLRLGLERADGLFVQPLVGRKKSGDYAPLAIMTAYRSLIDRFLPRERILLGVLTTAMRYAGPREAVFHAIIRRNFGCTHFIVGRDHAGVGDYYGKYEAHELTRQFDGKLGIEVLRFFGPFYCELCDGIVTERTCPHIETEPHVTRQISGTDMRSLLTSNEGCAPELMRPEVLESIRDMPIFITEDGN